MKKKLIFLLLILFTFANLIGACSNNKENEEIIGAGMGNPFVEYDTREEAEQNIGFTFQTPDIIQGYNEVIYRVAKSINLFEIIYKNGNHEIVYRKGISDTGDISGDYNDYDKEDILTIKGTEVKAKGDDFGYYTAIWTSGKFSYSYYYQTGQPKENFIFAVENVINEENK